MIDPIGVAGYSRFELIGSGGFSTVYRAFQTQFNRFVAIKVLSTPLRDESAQRRFLRECRIAGSLSGHPNIVTVLDAGIAGSNQPYIVFEFMSGGSLAGRVAEHGPLPVEAVLSVGVKLAGALAMVHRQGVLHRDVKPANILLSSFGEPCLTDFGISAAMESLNGTGMTASLTPLFTAPEVIEGADSTPAADTYSLGASLYSLLAGRAPFQPAGGESLVQAMTRILKDPPPPVTRPDLPPELWTIIEKALAKRPEERQPNVADLGAALSEVQGMLGVRRDSMLIGPDAYADALPDLSPRPDPPDATVIRQEGPPLREDDEPDVSDAPDAPAEDESGETIRREHLALPLPEAPPQEPSGSARTRPRRRRMVIAAAAGAVVIAGAAAAFVLHHNPTVAATVNGRVITESTLNSLAGQFAGNSSFVTAYQAGSSRKVFVGKTHNLTSQFRQAVLTALISDEAVKGYLATTHQNPSPDEVVAARAVNEFLRAPYWDSFSPAVKGLLTSQIADEAVTADTSSSSDSSIQTEYNDIVPYLFRNLCLRQYHTSTFSQASGVTSAQLAHAPIHCYDQQAMEGLPAAVVASELKLTVGQSSTEALARGGEKVLLVSRQTLPLNEDVKHVLRAASSSSSTVTSIIDAAHVTVNPELGEWTSGNVTPPTTAAKKA